MATKLKRPKPRARGKSPVILVDVIESEAGWGQKVDEVKTFKSLGAAKRFVARFNRPNDKATTPSWYMYAKIASIDGMTVL